MRVLLIFGLTACTTLGPMPATTGVSAIPMGRPAVEAQLGAMPGFMLSAATSHAQGTILPQLSALFDPDHLVLPGLIGGARLYGPGGDAYLEPYLGYRHRSGRVSYAGVAFGSHGSATKKLASYSATRIGGEVSGDVELWRPSRWAAFHAQGTVSTTYVHARGMYCVNPSDGVGVDCKDDPGATNTFVDGSLHGAYVSGVATIAADLSTWIDGRIAVLFAAGSMPRVRDGHQQTFDTYTAIGLSFTVLL